MNINGYSAWNLNHIPIICQVYQNQYYIRTWLHNDILQPWLEQPWYDPNDDQKRPAWPFLKPRDGPWGFGADVCATDHGGSGWMCVAIEAIIVFLAFIYLSIYLPTYLSIYLFANTRTLITYMDKLSEDIVMMMMMMMMMMIDDDDDDWWLMIDDW